MNPKMPSSAVGVCGGGGGGGEGGTGGEGRGIWGSARRTSESRDDLTEDWTEEGWTDNVFSAISSASGASVCGGREGLNGVTSMSMRSRRRSCLCGVADWRGRERETAEREKERSFIDDQEVTEGR